MHRVLVADNGTIKIGNLKINVGHHRAGQRLTAIRDHDRVTAYTNAGDPLGHIHLDHDKQYQGSLTPAA